MFASIDICVIIVFLKKTTKDSNENNISNLE